MDEMVPLAVCMQNGEVTGLSEDDESAMYYATICQLKSANFHHYEISNFCQRGYASRHNLNYWEAGDYLGLGAGAVSFKAGQRYRNIPQVDQYTQNLLIQDAHPPREIMESLEGLELWIDAMLMGLRMIQGINTVTFIERFGIDPIKTFAKAVTDSLEEGLMEYVPPWLRLTSRGYFLSNRVFVRIMEAI
jgi:oxygen-independent coproporphyrinogen-3 oxidase